jgi:hypothetical protein
MISAEKSAGRASLRIYGIEVAQQSKCPGVK